MGKDNDELMTLREVSAYLRVDDLTVHTFIREENNPLPAFKVGVQWRFYKNTVDDWVRKGHA